ncbi:MAG TPA: hypothetical protein VGK78_07825 [Nocardioides sp.]|uniref:hypothetical protein n=1 Tax=Nocardioides sp. TaxID=35761 RepID=UPI002F42ACCD
MHIILLPRAIRRELARVAPDAFIVQNLADGYVALERESLSSPMRWQGPARPLLDRLSELPDAAGAEAVVEALPSIKRRR